jgi:hypothetical protein
MHVRQTLTLMEAQSRSKVVLDFVLADPYIYFHIVIARHEFIQGSHGSSLAAVA